MSRDRLDRRDRHDPPTIEQRARRRVALKLGWLAHAAIFVVVNLGLWLLASMAEGPGGVRGLGGGHWRLFPLWGWGLGLAIHGLVVLFALGGDGLRERLVAGEVEAIKRREGGG